MRNENKLPLSVNEILYVFKIMAKYLKELYEIKLFLCDTKEKNIVLTLTE